MNKKIGLSEVKIEWLNKRALVLISIFAHAAYKSEKHIIDLRAEDVLSQVSSLVKASNNAELTSLYKTIKREIEVSISDQNVSPKVAKEVAKLSVDGSPAMAHNRYRPL
jgi:hypothetical protein